eukprot:m.412765 g.412765  ORF g.412765 m.412765 type:complete len:284 (-) comp20171_c0_seq6:9411-10262(-)
MASSSSDEEGASNPLAAPERLMRAQGVLGNRTGQFLLVLERCVDSFNHQAVLRTAEAFGVQHVWTVMPICERRHPTIDHKLARTITQGSYKWLSIRDFETTAECIEALKLGGWQIWASELSPEAIPLDNRGKEKLCPLPPKLAVVIGRETDGVSKEVLAAADRRVYLPMFGFTESFNLSVASALLLQRLFDWCPQARGNLPESEKKHLRRQWFPALCSPKVKQECAHWLQGDGPDKVPALLELRRPPDHAGKVGHRKPKQIRREAAALKAQQERRTKQTSSYV